MDVSIDQKEYFSKLKQQNKIQREVLQTLVTAACLVEERVV